jgi:ketosteroid isomerase-like protein
VSDDQEVTKLEALLEFEHADRAGMLALMAADVEWHPALAAFLTHGVYRGGEAVCDLALREIPSMIADFRGHVVRIEEVGPDAVVAEVRYSGRGVSSGVPLAQLFFQLYRFRGEKIASMHSYSSEAEALEAARVPG